VGLGTATPVIIPKLNANETTGALWNAQGSARPVQGRYAVAPASVAAFNVSLVRTRR
jgi:hypothetical protein